MRGIRGLSLPGRKIIFNGLVIVT